MPRRLWGGNRWGHEPGLKMLRKFFSENFSETLRMLRINSKFFSGALLHAEMGDLDLEGRKRSRSKVFSDLFPTFQKFCLTKIFRPKFFSIKIFWPKIFFLPKFCRPEISTCRKNYYFLKPFKAIWKRRLHAWDFQKWHVRTSPLLSGMLV